jgi:hypothetical protein
MSNLIYMNLTFSTESGNPSTFDNVVQVKAMFYQKSLVFIFSTLNTIKDFWTNLK